MEQRTYHIRKTIDIVVSAPWDELQDDTERWVSQNIVPDCLSFYLMSLYPLPVDRELSQTDRDMHVGAIQWVVNRAMGRQFYSSLYVRKVNMFMGRNKNISAHVLLSIKDYSSF